MQNKEYLLAEIKRTEEFKLKLQSDLHVAEENHKEVFMARNEDDMEFFAQEIGSIHAQLRDTDITLDRLHAKLQALG